MITQQGITEVKTLFSGALRKDLKLLVFLMQKPLLMMVNHRVDQYDGTVRVHQAVYIVVFTFYIRPLWAILQISVMRYYDLHGFYIAVVTLSTNSLSTDFP